MARCTIAMCCACSYNFSNSAILVIASLRLPRRSLFCPAANQYAWRSCATKLRASSRIRSTDRCASFRDSRSALSTLAPSSERSVSASAQCWVPVLLELMHFSVRMLKHSFIAPPSCLCQFAMACCGLLHVRDLVS